MTEYVTAEELRRCMDMVHHGECVTFPNGLVIDKRPLAYPVYVPPTPSQPLPTWPTYPNTYGQKDAT